MNKLIAWFLNIYKKVLNFLTNKNSEQNTVLKNNQDKKIDGFLSKCIIDLINYARNPKALGLEAVIIQDGVCGSGKTTSIFNYINFELLPANTENRIIFISPYLDELHRIAGTKSDGTKANNPVKDKQGRVIYKPYSNHSKGDYSGRPFIGQFNHVKALPTKLQYFKTLLAENKHIVATHKLFESLDQECLDLISQKRYHLIIDEEPIAITTIKDQYTLKIYKGNDDKGKAKKPLELKLESTDINSMIESGIISISDEKLVYHGPFLSRYKDFLNDVKEGKIIKYNHLTNSGYQRLVYLWMQNPSVFKSFRTCHVLTYKFKNSMLNAYFDVNSIPYLIDDLTWQEMLNEDKVKPYHQLVTLHKVQTSKILPERPESKAVYSLSSKWLSNYKEFVKETGKNPIQRDLLTFFKKPGISVGDKMWTTIKHAASTLEGNGYKKGFVSCNIKATNTLINRHHLAFMYNAFQNPLILNYLKNKNAPFSNKAYASSMLIQWVFRSALRSGKPINLLLPEERMHGLFKNWLDDFEQQYNSPRDFIKTYPNINNTVFKPEIDTFSMKELLQIQPGVKYMKNLQEQLKSAKNTHLK